MLCAFLPTPTITKQAPQMEGAGLLLHALITSPAETLERLEKCCADACNLVATDASSFISAFKLAHEAGARQCGASVNKTAKFIAAVREGLRNVAAALDAIASLCVSAMAFQDVEVVKAAVEEGRRGRQLLLSLQAANEAVYHHHWVSEMANVGGLEHHLKQCVDVPTFGDCELVCEVDKGKPNRATRLPRGRHSFTLHANVMRRPKHWRWPERPEVLEVSDASEHLTVFPLLPDEVAVDIHGDATVMWTCTQHPDGCGVVVDYAASPEPASVEIVVQVLGSVVYNQSLVNSLVHVLLNPCLVMLAYGFCTCRHRAGAQQPAFGNGRLRLLQICRVLAWPYLVAASRWLSQRPIWCEFLT